MKTKKDLLFLLVVLLIITNFKIVLANQVSQNKFNDIEGHWAKDIIKNMTSLEILNDEISKLSNFEPEKKITRSEVVELVLKANLPKEFLQTVIKDNVNTNSFNDTKNHKSKNYIELSKKFNIVSGYDDSTFKPDNLITREELAAILVRSQDFFDNLSSEKSSNVNFIDVDNSKWSYEYISLATKLEVVQGYPDNTFAPTKDVTRAEAYTMLENYYNICFINYNGIVGYASKNGKLLYDTDTTLIDFNNGKVVKTVKSNKYGQFRFDVADKNDYKIEISDGELIGIIPKVTTPLKVALLNSKPNFEKTIVFSGIAYDKDGKIVANTNLSFESKNIKFNATTDASGKFKVNLLPNHDYIIYKVIEGTPTYIGELNDVKNDTTGLVIKSTYSNTDSDSDDSSSDSNDSSSGGGGGGSQVPVKYNLIVNATTGGKITSTSYGSFAHNDIVYISAQAYDGYTFTNWSTSNGGTFAKPGELNTTFTMPSNSTTVTANFKKNEETIVASKYNLKVTSNEGGKILLGTNKEYLAGEIITIKAEPNEGYTFINWSSSNGGTFAKPSELNTTFTMPSNATIVTANFKKVESITTYALTVNTSEGGSITTGNSGSYKSGAIVNLEAKANDGFEFEKWTSSNDGTFAQDTNYKTTFTMPANETTVTATFKKIEPITYNLTVNASNGGSIITGNSGSYKIGTIVNLEAKASDGFEFENWTSSNGGTFAQDTASNTTFTMPANETTVTANFKAKLDDVKVTFSFSNTLDRVLTITVNGEPVTGSINVDGFKFKVTDGIAKAPFYSDIDKGKAFTLTVGSKTYEGIIQ